jgi:PAS domain S-box-containing protein
MFSDIIATKDIGQFEGGARLMRGLGETNKRSGRAAWRGIGLERRAAAYVILICIVMAVGNASRLFQMRQSALEAAALSTRNLSETLAQSVENVVDDADVNLVGIVEHVEAEPGTPDQIAALQSLLKMRVFASTVLRSLTVYGPDGRVIASSAPHSNAPDADTRKWFEARQADPTKNSVVGQPLRSPETGDWLIPISRQITNPDGSLAGIACAEIGVDYFERSFRAVSLGSSGVVGLALSDGTLLARWPVAVGMIGSRAQAQHISSADGTTNLVGVERISPIDGVRRIISRHGLAHYQATIFVGLGKDEALASWDHIVFVDLIGLTALIAMVGLLGARLTSAIRRRAEAERLMRAQMTEFRLLADNTTDMIFRMDLAGVRRYVSPAVKEIFGYDPSELIGSDISNAVHRDDAAQVQKIMAAFSAGQIDRASISARVPHRDGRWIQVDTALRLIRDEATGQPTEIVGSLRDVTAHHVAEERVRASEARYRLLADSSNDMIVQCDLNGTIEFVSPAAHCITGRSPTDLVGQNVIDLAHPADIVLARAAIDALGTNGEPRTVTYRIRHDDGRLVWVEVGMRLLKDDQTDTRTAIVLVYRDVSERKEAEIHLRDAVESINDGFILFDADSRFIMCNTSYRKLFPESNDLFVPGKHRREMLIAQTERGDFGLVGDVDQYVDNFIAQSCQAGAVFELPLADGRWVLGSDRQTSLGSWVGIRTDITGQKQRQFDLDDSRSRLEAQAREMIHVAEDFAVLKDEAERAKEEAERANQVKSEFLAMMSHEIRTPMNGVIGMNELLLSTKLSGEQRKFADAIRTSAESLLTIINDILDFSKLEAGKFGLEQLDFSPADIVEDVVTLMAPRAFGKGLEIIADIDPAVGGAFSGDPTRIRQILLNLASNAVKFTERGFVCVKAGLVPGPAGSSLIRFEVQDTGIGVADTVKAKLFQPFQQADSSITRRFGGTGLGLNISKQLVQLMQGGIGITDRAGGGSIFWVELALQPSLADPPPPQPTNPMQGKRALLVGGSEVAQHVLCRQLTAHGLDVVCVLHQEAALDAIDEAREHDAPFDIMLIDPQGPVDAPWCLLAMKSRLNRVAPLRLIMLSTDETVAAGDLAIDAILAKPVREAALLRCLIGGDAGSVTPIDEIGQAGPAVGNELRRGDILLAEDNLINQQIAVTILERAGYSVDVVTNGLAAIEAVQRKPYQIVLMDVQMPQVDGLEATRRIRTELGITALPIIAMTANAMDGDRRRCIDAGMNDYISKPIDPKLLVLMVERCALMDDTQVDSVRLDPLVEATPIVDEEHLANLHDILPSDRLLGLIKFYIESADDRLDRMISLVDSGDIAGLRHEAHDIISTAGNLGARRLQMLGVELQEACKDADLKDAKRVMAKITKASPEASIWLQRWVDSVTVGT